MKNDELIIVGASELGQQYATYLNEIEGIHLVGFLDDFKKIGEKVLGKPILGPVAQAKNYLDTLSNLRLIVAIGYRNLKKRGDIFLQLKRQGGGFFNLIHPSAYCDSTAIIGEGVAVFPRSVIDIRAEIADDVTVNSGTVVSHDAVVGRHSFLGPGVILSGFVSVGEYCFLGAGTIVRDNVDICSGVYTGAGAVVVKDITEPGTYVGVPARFLHI